MISQDLPPPPAPSTGPAGAGVTDQPACLTAPEAARASVARRPPPLVEGRLPEDCRLCEPLPSRLNISLIRRFGPTYSSFGR